MTGAGGASLDDENDADDDVSVAGAEKAISEILDVEDLELCEMQQGGQGESNLLNRNSKINLYQLVRCQQKF